ncbi:Hsp20/alpha crystallin family protein [Bacillus carboniphilus]|uniref:Hsp20/alpha crystallin family protein n=1 Tax=Bacillus carboniphilus TaxID=86663 RepID=A0ABP3GMG0_9BACI
MASKYSNDKNKKDPFQEVMNTMNDFFQHRPVKGFLQSIDEFFKAPGPFSLSSFPVHVEETDEEHIITAELPGVKKEQIHIDMYDRYLTISVNNAEIVTEENTNQHILRKRTSMQKTSRTVALPHMIDEKRVKAKYQDGLLTISVPAQKGKRLRIEDH